LPVYYYTNLLQVSIRLVVYWNLKQYTIQLQSFPAFLNAISNPVPTVSHMIPLYQRYRTRNVATNKSMFNPWHTPRRITTSFNLWWRLFFCEIHIFGSGFIWVISPKLTSVV